MRLLNNTLIILTPGFPDSEADTTCLPLQQALVKTIQQNNPALKLVILTFQYPYKQRDYTWHGIPVKAFGGKNKAKALRVYNWIKVWQALKEIKRTHDIKGILSFWLGECALIGRQFARVYGLKHHCWILGQDAKAGNRYMKMLKPKAEMLIAISDLIADNVEDNYGIRPAHVIPGGVDAKGLTPVVVERTIDILGVGSLIPLKQYHLFLEVVCRLRKHKPGIKAVLCGDGPERDTLKQMIRKLNLENNITLTGSIPHTQVLDLMRQSKIFLHPSNYEGLVMVCLEALYAGAKVISFVRCMDQPIVNWHIAESTLQMTHMAVSILDNPDTFYMPTVPFNIEDTARKMVNLYLAKPAVIPLNRLAIVSKESADV
jgi:glycosyltransferase involved in cell wall biosynthesis